MGLTSDEENDGEDGQRPGTPTSRKRMRGSELPKSKQAKHYKTKFSAGLQAKYPFLKADPKDPYKCICKVCDTGVGKSFRCEKSDIDRHVEGAKHKEKSALANPNSQRNVRDMLKAKDPLEKQVKYAELKLAGFVAAHDMSFLKMDHLTDVLKDIFPDSKIALGMSLKRTKTRGVVVNVIGAAEKDGLTIYLQKTKFSILTDESTDISACKTATIMVMFYDPEAGGVVTRHWELDDIFTDDDPEGAHVGATAEVLFNKMMRTFEVRHVPTNNMIGLAGDGCNAMMGAHNSVASRMKELCPGATILKCICHSLHLCASDACKMLPIICEDLARLIFSFFSHSSKRQAQFRQFQKFFDLDVHQMLHPSETRWLSMTAVVSRVLENLEPLKLFFQDQCISLRLKSAENILSYMNDPSVKAYFYFLECLLPKVTKMNEFFQSERPTITVLHSRMVTAYQEFLLRYMQRDYVMRTPLHEVNPGDVSRMKSPTLDNVYIGVAARQYLERPENAIRGNMVVDILTRCRQFLSTLCLKMKEKYDFADPVLSRMRLLNPDVAMSHRERENTPSIAPLCFLLPRCVAKDKVQDVDDEWRRFPLLAGELPDEVKTTEEPDRFWHKVLLTWRNDFGEQSFKALPEFALTALSLPVANAYCERDFTKVNNTKTKLRNKMITPTVDGCLLASQAVRKGEGCCVKFKPDNAMFSGMTAATIYRPCRPQRGAAAEQPEEDVDISALFSFAE